jgi:DNA-binding MarR family transcriptional regulator
MDPIEKGKLMERLNLQIFKLEGLLMVEAEKVLDGMKLTPARSRILGILKRSSRPMTIVEVCHEMGQTRQGVTRLVNLMVKDGHIDFIDNPDHQKIKLLALTPSGRAAHDAARDNQAKACQWMASAIPDGDLQTTQHTVQQLITFLEADHRRRHR